MRTKRDGLVNSEDFAKAIRLLETSQTLRTSPKSQRPEFPEFVGP